MDKLDLVDVAESVQGKLEDVILAGVLVEDSLESNVGRGYTGYAGYSLAGARILYRELSRIYDELTAWINEEFEKRKELAHADK